MKLFTSSLFTTLIGTILYLGTTFLFWKWEPPRIHSTGDPSHALAAGQPFSLEYTSPEIELLIQELKKEKEVLAKKASELKDLETRLSADKQELSNVTQSIQRMQKDFDQRVLRVNEEEGVNLKKLAKTYAAMAPEGAAAIFKEMEESAVVKIMLFMKETETAPILETMASQGETEARRVAGITDRLRLSINEKSTNAKKPNKP